MRAGFLEALQQPGEGRQRIVIAAELRPPRAELDTHAGMGAWIDTYHAVRALTRRDTFVCLTDSAVGAQEEDNLRHLVANLGLDVDAIAYRAVPDHEAHDGLLPGLRRAGASARLPGAGRPRRRQDGRRAALRRARVAAAEGDPRGRAELRLGGWANPHHDPASQVGYLLDGDATADFYLTQIVSHHDRAKVGAFVAEARGAA